MLIGRRPIGLFEDKSGLSQDLSFPGEKVCMQSRVISSFDYHPKQILVFLMKAHFFAGRVLSSESDITGLSWFAKKIEPHVDKKYWLGMKDMVPDCSYNSGWLTYFHLTAAFASCGSRWMLDWNVALNLTNVGKFCCFGVVVSLRSGSFAWSQKRIELCKRWRL